MAHEAKLSLATCVSAKLVETEQTQYWVDDRRSLADVVNLLDFGSKTPSPVFRLINFYERICKVHPESFFDLHDVLKKFYSDAMLAKLVVEAMSTNVSGATQLKDILFSHWFNMAITRERLNELLGTNNENMKYAFDPLLDSFDVFVAKLKKNTANIVDPISLNTKLSYEDMLTEFEKQLYSYNTKNPFKQLNLLALLSLHRSDEFLDKLLGESKLVPSTGDFFELLETQRFQHWADGGVPLDKAIERLDSGSKRNSVFFSRLIKLYHEYSNRHSDSLSKNYIPDNKLITFIGEATSVSLESAEQLRKMLFQDWFNRAMKPADIMKRGDHTNPRFDLKLEKYSDYYTSAQRMLLEHVGNLKSKNSDAGSVFSDFITLIRDLNKRNPTEQISIFAALTACFDEHEASTMIEAAKLDPMTKKVASFLENEQIEYWLDTGKTPLDVVKLFDFENKSFVMLHKWEEFCAAYRARNPNSRIDPIELLNPYFDDFTLATYVMEKREAKRLQDMLFQHWFDNGKSYDYINVLYGDLANKSSKRFLKAYNKFFTAKCSDESFPVFLSEYIEPENVDVLFKKVEQLNEMTHREKPIHFLATLNAIVRNEEIVSTILEAGRQNPKVQDFAISLQKLRSERWVKDKLSPTKSFLLQKLNLLNEYRPKLLTWVESLVTYNEVLPNEAESMFLIVKDFAPKIKFKDVFGIMTKDPRWEKIAEYIKNNLLYCLGDQIPPSFLHKLMWLDFTKPDIFKNNDFKRFVKYSVMYSVRAKDVGSKDISVWIILKTLAKTDTSTLIKRLKEATIVKIEQPWKWKSQVSKAIEYYSPKDQLVLNAWVDYVLTLDSQPLDWNMVTVLSTFCHASIFMETIGPKLRENPEQEKAIIYSLALAGEAVSDKLKTMTKQEFDVMFKRL
ncbi:hypothetical protein Plhal304r1_c031g0100021 [Plasmopara halstedii]